MKRFLEILLEVLLGCLKTLGCIGYVLLMVVTIFLGVFGIGTIFKLGLGWFFEDWRKLVLLVVWLVIEIGLIVLFYILTRVISGPPVSSSSSSGGPTQYGDFEDGLF